MADTINYGRSGRGGKDPRKTLTSAQRRKASMDRRGKEEKESGRRVTPAGGAGLIIGFVPGIGKGASAAGKGVYKVGLTHDLGEVELKGFYLTAPDDRELFGGQVAYDNGVFGVFRPVESWDTQT